MSERLNIKRFRTLVSAFVCFFTLFAFSTFISSSVNGAVKDESLLDKRNYSRNWASVDKSYIITLDDGGYMTFIAGSSGYTVDYYDSQFNHLSSKKISSELPLFGCFYSDSNGYYVLSGQTNPDESASVECYRLTKYDKLWTRKASCGLYDCNTYSPFEAGSASITSTGNYLVIRTCHKMYASADDGLRHQANVTILVNTSTMKILDSLYKTSYSKYGYSSHSFNQYVRIENNHIIGADHGDAYPRSMAVFYYKADVTSGKFVSSAATLYEPLIISGNTGNNYTGATLGGLEVSSSSYLIVGSSIDQNDASTTEKNIYVGAVNKSSGATSLKWLTSDAESNGTYGNPYIVKISSTNFAVIWSRSNTVYYAFIDGSGNLQGDIKTATGKLSDCQPVLSGKKIVWFINNSPVDFYYIDTSDKSFHQLYTLSLDTGSNGKAALSNTRAEAGEKVTVNVTPDDGYVLDTIKVNNSAISGKSFTMTAKNTSVSVTFKLREYDITAGNLENGTVGFSKTKAHVDEEITVTANPDEGYELNGITVNGNPVTGNKFTMPRSDVTVVASFKAIDYNVTVNKTVNGTASVDKPIANIGNKVTVSYTPDKCYQLDTIKINGVAITENPFTMPASDVTVTVTFKTKPHQIVSRDGKDPKCTENGYEPYFECSECGKLFSDPEGKNVISAPIVIKKLGHSLKLVKEVAPNKTSEGHWAYYECTRCHELFKDADGKISTTLAAETIPVMIHDLTNVAAKAATCTETGNTQYFECQDPDCNCHECFSDAYGLNKIDKSKIIIKSLGHDPKKVDAVSATCTGTGVFEHWKCSRCGTLFNDSEGKEVVSKDDTVAPPLGHDCDHLEHHEYKAPSRDFDGNEEYFICPRCGKKFSDSECKKPISDTEIVIPALGAPKLGEEAEVGDFKYKVTYAATDGTGTVTLIGIVNPGAAVSVPATVEIKETIYNVNRIGAKAFYNNKTIKTLVVGPNVTVIDNLAFYGCSNLVKVSGGPKLKIIGTYAFAYCTRLKTFVITSKVLSKIGNYSFKKDSSLKTVYIRNTVLLTKSGVKKSLKGSKVKKVKVKKSKVKKYKKYFTKKNCGRKVKVKK